MTEKIISTDVKLKTKGSHRSLKWTGIRNAYLRANSKCACCGSNKKCEVHHIQPFHTHPELDLEPTNFMTLCESKSTLNCHIIIGHGGNYRDVNLDCVKDAEHFNDLLTNWQTPKFEEKK